MTTTNRPTCGTCPHKLPSFRKFNVKTQRNDGEWIDECFAVPATWSRNEDGTPFEGRMQPLADTPGCIHHPQMAAYIAGEVL